MIPAAITTLFSIGSAIKSAGDAIKAVDTVVETVDKFTGSNKIDADEYIQSIVTSTVLKIKEARFETERSIERLRRTKKYIASGSMQRFIEQFSRVKPVEFSNNQPPEDVFVQQSELESMFENVNVNQEAARKFEAEGKQICSYLDEIKDRADQTNTRLLNLDNKLTNAVDEMEFVIERHGSDGAKLPNDAIEQLYHTFQIAKKINEIINTPLLSDGR